MNEKKIPTNQTDHKRANRIIIIIIDDDHKKKYIWKINRLNGNKN